MYIPKFHITPELANQIAEIEGIRTIVDQSNILPEKEIALRYRATVEAIHSSTTIEGNQLNKKQSELLPNLLSELFKWLEFEASKLHPVLAASILHYEFVSIHPFSDGNGRVTRLLTMLYLSLRQYDFRGVLVPEIYYLDHRIQYYNALNQAMEYSEQRNANLTPWIEFFIKGFLSTAKQLKTEITIAQSINPTNTIIRLTQEEIQLLDFVKQMGSISLEETLGILQIPRRTAQRRLSELVDKGLLQLNSSGKNTNYIAAINK